MSNLCNLTFFIFMMATTSSAATIFSEDFQESSVRNVFAGGEIAGVMVTNSNRWQVETNGGEVYDSSTYVGSLNRSFAATQTKGNVVNLTSELISTAGIGNVSLSFYAYNVRVSSPSHYMNVSFSTDSGDSFQSFENENGYQEGAPTFSGFFDAGNYSFELPSVDSLQLRFSFVVEGSGSLFFLDNIVVSGDEGAAPAPVPLPASVLSLGFGLASLMGASRLSRRRRARQA